MHRKLALIVFVIAIVGVFALPVAALAQKTQNKESDGFALLHMLKQGETVRFKIVQLISGTRTLAGASKPSPIDCELTSIVRIKCVKLTGGSVLELTAETESVSVRMTNREPRSMPPSKEARSYRIDQYGKPVVDKEVKTSLLPASRTVLDTAWLECLAIMPNFPEVALKAGSSWVLEVANPLQGEAKIKVSAKIEDLKETKAGWVATIKETIGLPDGQPAEINPDVAGGRIEGQIELKYLADKGRLLSAQGTLKTDSRTNMGVPGLPKSDLPMGSAVALRVEQFTCRFTIETLPPGEVSKPSGQK